MENETRNPEEINILTLTDEDGQDMEFEYLASIEYEGKEYIVLLPMAEDAPEDEIVVMEVEPVDEENENFLAVTDEAVLQAVFSIFLEMLDEAETEE